MKKLHKENDSMTAKMVSMMSRRCGMNQGGGGTYEVKSTKQIRRRAREHAVL